MEKSSSEQKLRIRKQFDSFCKTLLKNEMIDYERERNYRFKHEISFSELTQKELKQLEIMDDYIAESEMFRVFDYDIEVTPAGSYRAIASLVFHHLSRPGSFPGSIIIKNSIFATKVPLSDHRQIFIARAFTSISF